MNATPSTLTALAERLELWPIDRLRFYERNPRTHSADQVAQIATSMVEFGFTNPILVDETDGILAGHARLMAARQLGLSEVPVVRLGHASPAIGLELVLDGMHRLDESRVVDHHRRCVVEGGACDPHQPTAFGDGEAAGPMITDMGALGGRGPCR